MGIAVTTTKIGVRSHFIDDGIDDNRWSVFHVKHLFAI